MFLTKKQLSRFTSIKNFDFLSVILISIVVLATLRHLFPSGLYFAHDSVYQFVRLANFYEELTAGQFPVRWVESMVNGRGYPVFNYTYVLPYYFASFIHFLGVGFGNSIKLVTILSSLIAVLAWYRWLRFNFSEFSSFVGALTFWLAPYQLLSIFVTGQIGATTAFLWPPVLLIGAQYLFFEKKQNIALGILLFSGAIAGLITTHLISVIVFIPVVGLCILGFLLYELYILKNKEKQKKLLYKNAQLLMFSVLLGLGFSAFYWLPATLELKHVQAGHEVIVKYSDHFPTLKQLIYSSWGYGYSLPGNKDEMSFQIGFAQIFAIAVSGLVLLHWLYKRNKRQKMVLYKKDFLFIFSFISVVVTIFLMLEISQIVWQYIPTIQVVQHPWRFIAGVILASSILAAYLSSGRYKYLIGTGLVFLAILNTRNYTRPMDIKYHPDAELLQKMEMSGTGDVSGEFMPIAVTDKEAINTKHESLGVTTQLPERTQGIVTMIETSGQSEVVFNKLYFPHWKIKNNGEYIEYHASSHGLLAINLDRGVHNIEIITAKTKVQMIAEFISLFSFLLVPFFLIYSKRKYDPTKN